MTTIICRMGVFSVTQLPSRGMLYIQHFGKRRQNKALRNKKPEGNNQDRGPNKRLYI